MHKKRIFRSMMIRYFKNLFKPSFSVDGNHLRYLSDFLIVNLMPQRPQKCVF